MTDSTPSFVYRGHGPDEIRAAIERWVRSQGPELAATTVIGFHHPDHAGFSNVTLTAELDERARPDQPATRDKVAIRLLNEHPMYAGMDLRRQFDDQIRLRAHTDLPVPEMRWFGVDDPVLGPQLYAMGFVEGDIPSDLPSYHTEGFLLGLSPADRESLWWDALDHVVRLHRVDWEAAGFAFDDAGDDAERLVDAMIAARRDQLGRLERADLVPSIGAALDWLDANRPLELGPRRLCWGDARLPNMVFEGSQCVAMLDWEDLHLGWPQVDLAWFVYMDAAGAIQSGCDRLAGLPEAGPTVDRWSDATGLDPVGLEWATVYGAIEMTTGVALAFSSFVGPDQVADTLTGLEASPIFADLRARIA